MTGDNKIKTVSIAEWYEMAKSGMNISAKIPIDGDSMRPLIRRNIDLVTIEPISDKIRPGDILLIQDKQLNRYLLHRFIRFKDEKIITIGDNCFIFDRPFDTEDVRGRAMRIEHGKRVIKTDGRLARKLGLLLSFIHRKYIRIKRFIKKAIKKILRLDKRYGDKNSRKSE